MHFHSFFLSFWHDLSCFPWFSLSPNLIDKVATLICLIFSFSFSASISKSSFLPQIQLHIVHLVPNGAASFGIVHGRSKLQDYYSIQHSDVTVSRVRPRRFLQRYHSSRCDRAVRERGEVMVSGESGEKLDSKTPRNQRKMQRKMESPPNLLKRED